VGGGGAGAIIKLSLLQHLRNFQALQLAGPDMPHKQQPLPSAGAHLHAHSKFGARGHFCRLVCSQLGLQSCNLLWRDVGALNLGQCLAALLCQLRQGRSEAMWFGALVQGTSIFLLRHIPEGNLL